MTSPRSIVLCLGIPALISLGLGCGRIDTSVGAQIAKDASSTELDSTVPEGDAGPSDFPYIEAENGTLTGFTIASDPAASGGRYILPPPNVDTGDVPGQATAEYTFTVPSGGTYLVWGRIQAPGVGSNALWVSIDDAAPDRWQLSTGLTWFWGATTKDAEYGHAIEYVLTAGTHRVVFTNALPDIGLDRLFIGGPNDVPPGNTTPCNPPHSIQLADGSCEPSCGSHGKTTCGDACTGVPPLVAYDCSVCCFTPIEGGSDGGGDGGSDAGLSDASLD